MKQTFDLVKDPNSEGNEADIMAQLELLNSLKSDMNATVKMINEVEDLRKAIRACTHTISTHANKHTSTHKFALKFPSQSCHFTT